MTEYRGVDVKRKWLLSIVLAAATVALAATPAAGFARQGHAGRHGPPTVTVGGAVTAPATYTVAQLAAMPQSTFTTSEP